MVARRSSSTPRSYHRTAERSDDSASRSTSRNKRWAKPAPDRNRQSSSVPRPSRDRRQTIQTTSPFRRPPRDSDARSHDRSDRSQSSASIPRSISLTGSQTTIHTAELEALPGKYWEELEKLKFHYPGWERDYTLACESYHLGNEDTFIKSFRKLRDKQKVYDDYKAFSRLNEIANLALSYPGSENDLESLELWHLKHPSTEANDIIFQDKLNGLRNKNSLYFGDRSHPDIVALDSLNLSYPGWEDDYQAAVGAHCDTPERKFWNVYHRLQQKQNIHEGDRTHWRLAALDRLSKTLTYTGWERDVADVENWHIDSLDNDTNDRMFAEVLEGMKDQQQIFMGWNHEDEDGSDSESDDSANVQGDFYKLDVKKAKDLRKCYDSITESLQAVEGKRKQLLQNRSGSSVASRSSEREARRSPSPTRRDSSSRRGRASPANYQARTSPSFSDARRSPSPAGRDHSSKRERTSSGSYQARDSPVARRSPSPASRDAASYRGRTSSGSYQARDSPASSVARRSPSPTPRDSSSYRGRGSPGFYQARDSPVSYYSREGSPVSRARTASFQSRTSLSTGRVSPARTSAASGDRLPPKQVKFGSCVVCMGRPKTHVFVPCGHLCACAACSTHAMETNQCCPICRHHADSSYRVFMS